jgi:hypothetical protein
MTVTRDARAISSFKNVDHGSSLSVNQQSTNQTNTKQPIVSRVGLLQIRIFQDQRKANINHN